MATIGMEMQGGEFRQHWRALAGATLAASIGTVGFYAFTSGAFVGPLMESGYSRAELSIASLLISIVVALASPFAGQLMDRFGAFPIIAVCVLGEALGFLLLGFIPVDFRALCAAAAALALLGVGTTPPGFARIVSARFDAKRGLALGVMIAGPGSMAMTGPLWITALIEHSGWRAAYWTMALLVLVCGSIGLALIGRDGARQAPKGEQPSRDRGSWAALRRPLFWLLLFAFLAPAFVGSGYLFHTITILRERGFSPEQAAQVQALIGVAIVTGRLTSGAAVDRLPAQRVAAAIFALSGLGSALMATGNGVLAGLAALGIGLTIGAEQDLLAYLISRHFGLASFGRLFGLAYAGLIAAAGASPLLISTLADWRGYEAAFVVSICGMAVSVVTLLLLPPAPRAVR